jgi:peptide/nickel transport system substrate-binding protein
MLDKDNNYTPGLAEDWRWIADRTIEFKLRQGVTFHNGEKFDAEAVRVNWEEYKRMETPKPVRFINLPDETQFEIIDDYTVRFTLPQPDGLALVKFWGFAQFAPAFFTEHKFDEMNWAYLPEAGPWGTGPFKFMEGGMRFGRFSDRFVLEAYEGYWDRRYPKLKKVIFDNTLIGNRKAAMRLCRETEGKVDIVSQIRPLDTLKIAESPFAKVVKSRDVTSLYGFMNQRKRGSKWRDVRLRKALNYSINRKELWRYSAKAAAYNLEGFPLPVGAYGHNPNLTPWIYDTNRARKLLAEAGYPNGFEVKIITSEWTRLEVQIISRMLERIGLRVKTEVLTFPELMSKTYHPMLEKPIEEYEWDIAFIRPADFYGHSAASILVWDFEQSDWTWIEYDPVYEEMWKAMAGTVDKVAQEEKIRHLVQYLHDHAYRLSIYSPLALYAVNKEVNFVPYKSQWLRFKETSVTENHWSIRGKSN